ncbi:MAG: hypothetical protein Q8O72_10955 [Bacteroidales bacterium]|nr:hypothetical protein [Bacteroidales bacterium]
MMDDFKFMSERAFNARYWKGDEDKNADNTANSNTEFTLTGQTAQSFFYDVLGGMSIYMVSAFGQNTLVSSLGDIGFIHISEDGGINFSNPGRVYIPTMEITANGGGGFWGDALIFTDKHFNGGLSTVGVSVHCYNQIPNDIKRAYAHKLSKMTGVKSGQIFQGAKGFANGTGKLVSKLGPVGTVLGVGVISYEVGTNTWDAHTIVNGTLMVGAGVAAVFVAPVVLTGIAVYGVGDYFFGFGDIIDNNIGRNSGVWEEL